MWEADPALEHAAPAPCWEDPGASFPGQAPLLVLKVTSTWIEEFFLPHPLHLDGILPETQHQIFPLVPWELQKLNPSAGTTLAIPFSRGRKRR